MRGIPIPVPPLPDQQRIVAVLDEAFEGLAIATANTEKNLKNARELFENYLGSVFSNFDGRWQVRRVSEIAGHCLGKMLDKAKNRGDLKPYLRNLNVRWFEFDLSDLLEMRFEPSELVRYSAKKGDVLICEGGYPGRSAIWESDEDVFFQKALHRLRFFEPTHNKWFLYFIYYCDKSGQLKKAFTGSGIQHFTGQALSRFQVPVPPIANVIDFTKKFDVLYSRVLEFEQIYTQKLTAIAELKQSLLRKAFAGELTKDFRPSVAASSAASTVTSLSTVDLHAGVLAMAYDRHHRRGKHKTFGRVKGQKFFHLVESVGRIDLGRAPIKDAAGPNDFQHMLRAEDWARQNQFFEFAQRPSGTGYDFKKLQQFDAQLKQAQAALEPCRADLNKVIDLILDMTTEAAELFATVHAAWNNLIIDKAPITDQAIVREARENWHNDKLKIPEERFHNALNSIRTRKLEPDGTAKYVGGQTRLI